MDKSSTIVKWGGIYGIIGCLIFFVVQIFAEQLFWQKHLAHPGADFLSIAGTSPGYQITMATHLLIGVAMLCFIVAFVSLRQLLEVNGSSAKLTTGFIFGIIACAIMTGMMLIQGTVMAELGEMFVSAADEAAKQNIQLLYRGLRRIDYALDLAFDLFFFTSWIVLGLVMMKHPRFGKIFGSIGVGLFVLITIINAYSAPRPPQIELAPVAVIWIAAVYVLMIRAAFKMGGNEIRNT
jgi:hypothetical protein